MSYSQSSRQIAEAEGPIPGSESSPQGRFDYFAVVEDVLERPLPETLPEVKKEDFDFRGFLLETSNTSVVDRAVRTGMKSS